MPKLRILLPALLLGLCLPAAGQQVYRSTDAQGNITFSDKPTSGSEAVTIDAPNVADPVAVPPPSAAPEPPPEPKPAIEAAPDLEGDLEMAPNTRKNKKKRRRNRPTPFDYEYGNGR